MVEAIVDVVANVVKDYNKEMTARQERTIGNLITLLDKKEITEEIVRARILAKSKAFTTDLFNASVEGGLY